MLPLAGGLSLTGAITSTRRFVQEVPVHIRAQAVQAFMPQVLQEVLLVQPRQIFGVLMAHSYSELLLQ